MCGNIDGNVGRKRDSGEHFEGEDTILFGQAKGIVLIDGEPLRGIIIPKVSKRKLLQLLQAQTSENRQ